MKKLSTSPEFPANLFQLDNGLTVIHQNMPATPVAVVDVWVKAGAANEPDAWSGMAHFLEHTIFRGTEKLQPGEFDQVIEDQGGFANAATSHDYAHFFITSAADLLPTMLPSLADLLLHASIPDEEFYIERDVVTEEIRQADDDPDWLMFQTLLETIYPHHPYGRSVLGKPDLLQQRSPEQMRQFHHTYYQPDNMTVAIVGGIEEDKALSLVEENFQDFPTPTESPRNPAMSALPLDRIRRTELRMPRLEHARLSMGWLGTGVRNMHDAYGLDLISAILSEGRSSRLVRHLRESKGLVHEIGSQFTLQKESSLLTIHAWLDPENLEIVEKEICRCIEQIQFWGVTPIELARAKRLLCNDYAFSTETPSQLAGLYGYYQTITTAEQAIAYPEQIQSFTPAELQRIAIDYLSCSGYAVAVLKPTTVWEE
ncbi:pitrilysin family protein [Geitlerinema sp. PCC 9228]|uniref:M16 family metallopeptidase n=1 Tax=Geitlerinema sp. PCC 9228 TaxID=111611 RepID=UPI001B8C8D0B|nr:pitrilysin family protein [Geitlerinema sp. PCC 9228]